jgi:hypothetical protein
VSLVAWAALVACGTGGQANTGSTDGGACPTVRPTSTCAPCMIASCPTESSAALGPNWTTNDFTGGACSDLVACYCACGEDRGCVDACDVDRISSACHDALAALDACTKASCVDCSEGTFPDAGPG